MLQVIRVRGQGAALRHGAHVGSASGAVNTTAHSGLPDERLRSRGAQAAVGGARRPRPRLASCRLCDIFGAGPGNCTFGVGLTNRLARLFGMTALFAGLSRPSTVVCVTSAPEIAMSSGTPVAGNGPKGNFPPHRSVKTDRNGAQRIRPSAAAGGVSFASPFV